MKIAHLLAFSMAFSPLAWADRETRDLDAFTHIRIKASAEVELRQGTHHDIEITADASTMERLRTEVNGDRLTISVDDKWFSWFDDHDLSLIITFEDLEEIEILGSSDVEGEDLALENLDIHIRGSGDVELETLSAERLEVTILGAGDVELTDIDTADVATVIRGSGNISLSGHATTVEATIQGSGDLSADDLSAEQVSVVISGSGNASVSAETSLDAVIRGSGNIRYEGDAEVTKKIYGSGNVVEM